jgi:hypothetical protein
MSILPIGQSLRQFFPDLDEFLRDPSAHLEARPVQIGPRRAYGHAALFAAFGVACLVACMVSGQWRDERLLLGIACLIASSVWLGWSLRMRGHSLVLHAGGVELRHFDTVVWCPWALFNADGKVVVPEGDNPRVGVVLPVAPEALPFVELRKNDSLVGTGGQIRAGQFRFLPPDRVVLAARYELAQDELGRLLLLLGNRLGRQLPPGLPSPEVYSPVEPALVEMVGPDSSGWYTAPLGSLHFPARCCDCAQPTEGAINVPLGASAFTSQLAGTGHSAELSIPLCRDCQLALGNARQRGGIRGLNIGAVGGLVLLAGFVLASGAPGRPTPLLAGLAGAAIGGLLGFLIGTSLTRALPVQLRRYRPDQGTVQIRFRDREFADLTVAASEKARAMK